MYDTDLAEMLHKKGRMTHVCGRLRRGFTENSVLAGFLQTAMPRKNTRGESNTFKRGLEELRDDTFQVLSVHAHVCVCRNTSLHEGRCGHLRFVPVKPGMLCC